MLINPQPIVLVAHYLSVDVYANLVKALVDQGEDAHLLLLSSSDLSAEGKDGLSKSRVSTFEQSYHGGSLDNISLESIYKQYPYVPWGSIIAGERSFTDYSFSFGAVGGRLERADYIVPLVLRLVAFFESEFDRLQPKAVVSVYGDNIYTAVASAIAKAKRIPILIPHPSHLNEDQKFDCGYFANTPLLESYAMARAYIGLKSRHLEESEKKRARAFSSTLLNYQGQKTLGHIYKNKDFEKAISPQSVNIISYIKSNIALDKNVSFYKINFTRKIKANALRFIRQAMTKNFLGKQSLLISNRLVFFPMHFQPEASTLVSGIWYANQIALIENLSKAMPLGYTLVVKEHPRGRGLRPLWQYKHLSSLFNVQFSDLDSKSIVKKCDAVITISGSIGLEALAMKKPVIMLGRTFHTFHDLYHYPRSFEHLCELLQKILFEDGFAKTKSQEDEVMKVFLAYLAGIYDVHPFNGSQEKMAKLIISELKNSNIEAEQWLDSQFFR